QPDGGSTVSFEELQHPEVVADRRHLPELVALAGELQALLVRAAGASDVTAEESEDAEVRQRRCDPAAIADGAGKRQRLLERVCSLVEVAELARDDADAREAALAQGRRRGLRSGERPLEQPAADTIVRPRQP